MFSTLLILLIKLSLMEIYQYEFFNFSDFAIFFSEAGAILLVTEHVNDGMDEGRLTLRDPRSSICN